MFIKILFFIHYFLIMGCAKIAIELLIILNNKLLIDLCKHWLSKNVLYPATSVSVNHLKISTQPCLRKDYSAGEIKQGSY